MNDGDPGPGVASSTETLLLTGGLILCFLLAGMISGFVTLARMRQQGLLDEDELPRGSRGLLDRSKELLLALSTSHLVIASLSASVLPRALGGGIANPWIRAVVWAGFFAVLLVGSLLFKSAALSRPLAFVRSTLPLAWVIQIVLRPVTRALLWLVRKLAPDLGAMDISPPLSGGELRAILVDEDAEVEMEEEERDLVRSIFDLRDTEIREIMVPRVDLKGLEVETSFEEAEAFAVAQPFTRLPVWEESQDRILGILHTKDLLVARVSRETPTVRQLLRPIHFLPESKSVDEALQEFREKSVHLAVVVDEYGGTAGIVTMEDILEEIVGEIRDEFDVEGERIRIVGERRAILDPRIDLDDLNEELDLALPTEDSDTLGGFLYSELGRVPSRGDTVEYEGLHFTIDRLDRQRMLQVTLRSTQPLPPREGNGSGVRGGES